MTLNALAHFSVSGTLDTFISLTVAFILGGLIGYERQFRQRTAGLRTNVLVAVGAALFVDIAMRYFALYGGTPSPLHVVAYVVSGVGFLGAGVIMREEGNIRGINTAATLWGSAAVGVAAGADFFAEAVFGTLFVLAANTLLRPLVNAVNRKPLDAGDVEATLTLTVITSSAQQKAMLKRVKKLMQAHALPMSDLDVRPFGEDDVEIEATLGMQSVESAKLDHLVEELNNLPDVRQAFWASSTSE